MTSRWTYVLLVLALVVGSGRSVASGHERVGSREELAARLGQRPPITAVCPLGKLPHETRSLTSAAGHGALPGAPVLPGTRWSCAIVRTAAPSRTPTAAARRAASARGPPRA